MNIHGSIVLIVEDDPDVQEIAVNLILSLGFEAFGVSTGVEAMEMMSKHAGIVILFVDLVLGRGMNGLELALETRRLYPEKHIVLTTGYPEFSQHHPGKIPDDLPVLRKPYRKIDLFHAFTSLGFSSK